GRPRARATSRVTEARPPTAPRQHSRLRETETGTPTSPYRYKADPARGRCPLGCIPEPSDRQDLVAGRQDQPHGPGNSTCSPVSAGQAGTCAAPACEPPGNGAARDPER